MHWGDGIDLPALQSVTRGWHCFTGIESALFVSNHDCVASFADLPALTSLFLHSQALRGARDETALFPGEKPGTFTNTLSMIDLPSLRHIRGWGLGQFRNMHSVTLKSECD